MPIPFCLNKTIRRTPSTRPSATLTPPPQVFHPLYHSDASVLIGAPTGSGKTVMAELAALRCFRMSPQVLNIHYLVVILPWTRRGRA
jgi:replicative superfamily II helicase